LLFNNLLNIVSLQIVLFGPISIDSNVNILLLLFFTSEFNYIPKLGESVGEEGEEDVEAEESLFRSILTKLAKAFLI
jgi:hypothetical protein